MNKPLNKVQERYHLERVRYQGFLDRHPPVSLMDEETDEIFWVCPKCGARFELEEDAWLCCMPTEEEVRKKLNRLG